MSGLGIWVSTLSLKTCPEVFSELIFMCHIIILWSAFSFVFPKKFLIVVYLSGLNTLKDLKWIYGYCILLFLFLAAALCFFTCIILFVTRSCSHVACPCLPHSSHFFSPACHSLIWCPATSMYSGIFSASSLSWHLTYMVIPPGAIGTCLLFGEVQFSTSTSINLYLEFIASVITVMGRPMGKCLHDTL